MADIVTFDPTNLRIVEIDVGGDNTISWQEIYSEWKDWTLADSTRLTYPPAFSVVGGEPRTATQNLGATFFLSNRWRLRPAESDHRLRISGNVATDPFGEQIIVPTLGGYTVAVEYESSNIIDGLANLASAVEIADAVLDEVLTEHTTIGSLGEMVLRTGRINDNRYEFELGPPAKMKLYDDSGTSVIREWVLTTNGGEPVTTQSGVQTKRGAPSTP